MKQLCLEPTHNHNVSSASDIGNVCRPDLTRLVTLSLCCFGKSFGIVEDMQEWNWLTDFDHLPAPCRYLQSEGMHHFRLFVFQC